jgi:hypothetical protein
MQVVTVGAPLQCTARANDCQMTYRILPMRLVNQYERNNSKQMDAKPAQRAAHGSHL